MKQRANNINRQAIRTEERVDRLDDDDDDDDDDEKHSGFDSSRSSIIKFYRAADLQECIGLELRR